MSAPRRYAGLVLAALAMVTPGAGADNPLDACNVVWTSPSRDSSGSMPLGNGDIGLNVWVEPGGDLLFYLSKSDAWSENARLLKLGRVRVAWSPNPFGQSGGFRQELRLAEGEIAIRGSQAKAAIWVDANHPVVHLEFESRTPRSIRASLELWRTRERRLEGREIDSAYGLGGGPDPVIVSPDTVMSAPGDDIVWFHRNLRSVWPLTMRLQGLESLLDSKRDPLMNRTFGGLITGPGLRKGGPTILESVQPSRRHRISIYALTSLAPGVEAWWRELQGIRTRTESADIGQSRKAHRRWWSEFWERSWIRAHGTREAETATRGYTLQRFLNACAGRGAYPIKFNGSIFTVDAREPGETYDADYRRWGGPYWFQNTRLAYWPMLAAGDFDLMRPLFRMYLDALPLAKARTPLYFGHSGAFFPETMYFWGTYANTNYGWNRAGKPLSYVENTYIRYYWQGGLELIAMMLDYFAHTADDGFAKDTLLPLAGAIVDFYDRHYPRDANGRLRFQPASALETWHEAVNPMPEIAGLRAVLPRLAALAFVPAGQKAAWERLYRELPPIPTARRNGEEVLVAAEKLIGPIRNSENPELYAIFPYRLFGAGKPGLELARRSFERRRQKGTGGWYPDSILAAHLGLADTAASYVVENFSKPHPGSRFPAFWGPNFDWIPDQDHGCVAMIAFQSMLLQTQETKILILPAWPKAWDVEFRLRAPGGTTVEGDYRQGRLRHVRVTPAWRAKDLAIMEPQS